jgi:hypothetical protein
MSSLAVLLSVGCAFCLGIVASLQIIIRNGSLTSISDVISLLFIVLAFGLMCLPSAVFAGLRIRKPEPVLLSVHDLWPGTLLALIWVISLAAGRFIPEASITRVFIFPVAHILAVLAPILWILWFTLRGMGEFSMQRLSGLFNLSMIAAPAISSFFEVIILFGFFMMAVIYLALNPEMVILYQNLAKQVLDLQMNAEQLQSFWGVYLQSPIAVCIMLLFFSIATPIIEEIFKPLALLVFRKTLLPREGFIYGLVCGAAFAFFETLLSALQASPSGWLLVVVTRAGTGMLHMFTAGFVGMGLAEAFQKRSLLIWFRNYLIAVIIHGVWNAGAILSGIAGLSQPVSSPWKIIQIAAPITLGLVSVAIFTGLFLLRRSLLPIPIAPSTDSTPPE